MAQELKSFTIPILPHLKKFILKFHRTNEPLKVEATNSVGIVLQRVVTNKKKVNPKDIDRYTDRLRVDLNKVISNWECRPSYLIMFNVEYDRFFKECLFTWVLSQENMGINNSQAIKNFLEYYNIREDEYSWNTAFRAWTRWKNGEYSRIKAQKQKDKD